jgi:hypothetical protein
MSFSLCLPCVLHVSVVKTAENTHHRDAENTEQAQRLYRTPLTSPFLVLLRGSVQFQCMVVVSVICAELSFKRTLTKRIIEPKVIVQPRFLHLSLDSFELPQCSTQF